MKTKGFTLVELLVVISVISFVSSITFSSVNSARIKARDAQRLSQLSEVINALELYRNDFGRYPVHASGFDETLPGDWQSMIMDLNANNYLKATFTMSEDLSSPFTFIKRAHAIVAGPSYFPCSIQDPLYLRAEDYGYSYGYAATGGGSGYKVRVKLENTGHSALSAGYSGTFINSSVTGSTACDKSLGYYCKSI